MQKIITFYSLSLLTSITSVLLMKQKSESEGGANSKSLNISFNIPVIWMPIVQSDV